MFIIISSISLSDNMVVVKPFKGITYNSEKIEKLDDVMAPPYDIISPEMQEELYRKNEYNVVRLILGKIYPDDDEKNNRYTRAREFFEKWLNEGILVESDEEAIYPYKVEYKCDGENKVMNGFFILLKLDHNYEKVKAHEKTLSKPKEDRLKLMRETRANLEPIELLYMDEKDEIMKKIDSALGEPIIDVTGYDGFRHKLWKISDGEIIEFVKDKLSNEILYIADGHHRYQTAINYAEEVGAGEEDPENYIMVVLANMFDKGLTILPTHRMIKMDIDINELMEKCKEYFDVEKVELERDLSPVEIGKRLSEMIKTDKEHKFAVYHRDGTYILTLKDESVMDEFAPDRSKAWRTLDVSILHKIVIEKLMGITDKNLEDHVKYTRDTREAIDVVNSGKFDMSFILNPTKIEEIKEIASAGEHMPQKSTYFLPKLLSGLVMRKFH